MRHEREPRQKTRKKDKGHVPLTIITREGSMGSRSKPSKKHPSHIRSGRESVFLVIAATLSRYQLFQCCIVGSGTATFDRPRLPEIKHNATSAEATVEMYKALVLN
mmetsp:Transcript_11366/g.21034  ORF Transcript_11366/g.21034 Transcript_11366/m.21034 type:complete len:106 (+) Transcript_11366:263-580(+)